MNLITDPDIHYAAEFFDCTLEKAAFIILHAFMIGENKA